MIVLLHTPDYSQHKTVEIPIDDLTQLSGWVTIQSRKIKNKLSIETAIQMLCGKPTNRQPTATITVKDFTMYLRKGETVRTASPHTYKPGQRDFLDTRDKYVNDGPKQLAPEMGTAWMPPYKNKWSGV